MSKKIKKAYFCSSCGYESVKWLGKCLSCNAWNTFVEEIVSKPNEAPALWGQADPNRTTKAVLLNQVDQQNTPRITTEDKELNRTLGGGIVAGSLVLIGGEPGIGKSTLLLQIALQLASLKVLYVSGEESEQQIKMRADRLAWSNPQCFVLNETNLQRIFQQIDAIQPDLLIVDSIQTIENSLIESAAGSVSQVRACAVDFLKFAKQTHTPVFLIGHITKDGSLAGPKVLEHAVDTVLHFEGDRHLSYRILRCVKNRFGSASEMGIYEMRADGLRQVHNPSEILLSQRDSQISGITIGTTLEGNRPLLIEVQSLVSTAAYGTAQRSTTGFDSKRLNMLLAVLEKRCGFRFGAQDVFLNIAGGFKIEDPAIDLAVCVSLISSLEDRIISSQFCFAAEVGLGGEIRAVQRVEQRILEAQKLGFKAIFVSKYSIKGLDLQSFSIEVHALSNINELTKLIL